jgi:hypothetical protein
MAARGIRLTGARCVPKTTIIVSLPLRGRKASHGDWRQRQPQDSLGKTVSPAMEYTRPQSSMGETAYVSSSRTSAMATICPIPKIHSRLRGHSPRSRGGCPLQCASLQPAGSLSAPPRAIESYIKGQGVVSEPSPSVVSVAVAAQVQRVHGYSRGFPVCNVICHIVEADRVE